MMKKTNAEASASRHCSADGCVWELVDESHDEIYWPIGIFRDAVEASLAVGRVIDQTGVPPCEGRNDADVITLALRQRRFGLHAVGDLVWRRHWLRAWDTDGVAVWTEC